MSSAVAPPGGSSPAAARTRLATSWSAHGVSPLSPIAPTLILSRYSGSPPPKVMTPPQTSPMPPAESGALRHFRIERIAGARPVQRLAGLAHRVQPRGRHRRLVAAESIGGERLGLGDALRTRPGHRRILVGCDD